MRILLAFLFIVIFGNLAEAREITFSWEPFENVYAYEIRVAEEPTFAESLLRKGTKKPSYTVDLPIGKYFYKVRALDQNKRPGQWSDAVPFTIPPYAPELKAPKTGSLYSYLEIPPSITLEWKSVEGETEYEVLVTKTSGQKMFEQKTKALKVTVDTLHAGEYSWKVRTIYKEVYESPYTEPRFFAVEQKEFKPPELIDPVKQKVLAAYRPIDFSWKKDPTVNYSDVLVQQKNNPQGMAWRGKDLKDSETYQVEYMEPGEYQWTATNKEAPGTPGHTAQEEHFSIRNDFVASGNTIVSLGVAPSFYLVRGGGEEFARSSLAYYLNLKYYLSEVLGLGLDYQNSHIDRAPNTIPYQRSGASLLVRGGAVGFAQDWIFGFRMMDLLLIDPTENAGYFMTAGVQTGLSMYGTVGSGWKFLLSGIYYKPISTSSVNGALISDHYEFEIGFSYNLFDQFWTSYKFRSEKTVSNVRQGSNEIGFESIRTEPVYLGISWEY